MSQDFMEITTPVGRLVSGNLFKGKTTDMAGKPLLHKSGANEGQPRSDFYCAIAIEKTNPEWAPLHLKIFQAAAYFWPNYFDANLGCKLPDFRFKITDGDSQIPNMSGTKPCDRTGFRGCFVINLGSGFASDVYGKDDQNRIQVIKDPDRVKLGYYVRAVININTNKSQQTPGIYLNHSLFEMMGFGEVIRTGPDAQKLFAQGTAYTPAGMSAAPPADMGAPPMAATSFAAPGVPGAIGAPVMVAGGPPATGTPGPTSAPVVGAAPAMGAPGMAAPQFASTVPAQGAPPPPPAPDFLQGASARTYAIDGVAYTAVQLLGFGWTQQQIDGLPQ